MPSPKRRLSHDTHVSLLALLAGFPAVVVAMVLVWSGEHTLPVRWTISLCVLGCWLGFAIAIRTRVAQPLQTMANLLSALREGDFSIRARGVQRQDPLGEMMTEINALGALLQEQRLGALEASALLRTVMEEIDVAIFAFDGEGTLRLVNRAGQHLLALPPERILGRTAADVGLADTLSGQPARLLDGKVFPQAVGRWGMRRTTFRERGRPHSLVVVTDLTQPLREEELQVWQRIVRVLGHELNNSLTPIKSIAGSLGALLKREPRPRDWEEDMRSGLDIISARAEGLARFLHAYARLARLPAPAPVPARLTAIIHRVAALENRLAVKVEGGPDLTVVCDPAQIEQVLINLVRNAVEAALEQRASRRELADVRLRWRKTASFLEIEIEDDGPGIAQTSNLFVPFFTTKSEGSGIGLILGRQIAENHGGTLALTNRPDTSGCVATLRLPL